MADLPMAQIPNFSLGATPVTNSPQMAIQGIQGGGAQAIQAAQFQQEQAQRQKQLDVEKNMKMLETGSQMMLEGGPEVMSTGQQLIQKSYPFLTGQPLPEGMPIGKEQAKDLGWAMDQHRLFVKTNGAEGLSAQDAVTLAIQNMSRYGSKYQQQQMGLLEKDPMYKEAMANQVGGQVNGQPATKNEYTGQVSTPGGQSMPGAEGSFVDAGQAATFKQKNMEDATSNFTKATEDHTGTLSNVANALNMIAQPLPANPTQEQKIEFALHDKNAMIKYAQAMIPASKRPPNMTMTDMIKSGLAGEEAKSIFLKATNNVPMSNEERAGITETLGKMAVNTESELTNIENASASRAVRNGVDPSKAFQNVRHPFVPNTSSLFKSQSVPSQQVQTGQIMKNPGDGKPYVFIGQAGTQDWKNKSMWKEIK